MEELSKRERSVIAEMTALARAYGRWPTVREVGDAIADRERKTGVSLTKRRKSSNTLSVSSTFRALAAKGYLIKEGHGYALRGFRVKVKSAVVVKG